jgi:hypothetical protein
MKLVILLAVCMAFLSVFRHSWLAWVFGIGAIVIMAVMVLKSIVNLMKKE